MGHWKVIPVPYVHFGWLIQRTGVQITENFKAIAVIDENGWIKGMVGYDNWLPNSVQCHMAVDTPAAWRSLVFENGSPAFSYPFEECGRGILLALIRSSNLKSRRLTESFGFTETHRVVDGVKTGEDLIVYEMRKENCKWLRPKLRVVANG